MEGSTGFYYVHFVHRMLMLGSWPWFRVTRIPPETRSGIVIVCPPGGGNIGDQALVESAAWNVDEPVTLIVRAESNIEIPRWLAARGIVKIALPRLLYGMTFAHLMDVVRFIAIARRSTSVMIIGADIMDGRYSAMASLNRWSLALLARSSGANTSVLGFSWNSSPHASCETGLLKADESISLWLRDPVSHRRVKALGAKNAKQCSDIVFAHPARELPLEFRKLPDSILKETQKYGGYAIVNASGYIGTDDHVISEYQSIVQMFADAGLGVVFLPHVMRGASDLECLRRLNDLCEGRSVLVDHLLSPAQVGELATGARLVVTGRMHLAVLSSLARTSVLTLATQGKVDGLYELLERPDWVLDSQTDFSGQVGQAMTEVIATDFKFPRVEALQKIQTMAHAPFE